MERNEVNPWEWSKGFGFSQAVEVVGAQRMLVCSGQTAIGPDGSPPQTDDLRAQVEASLANLQVVLAAAGMAMTDVVRLTVYTTDMDAYLGVNEALQRAFHPALPAMTLIGVTRLAYPQLKVEIEATAVQ
jgi:enamine deaminase RidA (YjgF/YER057c/UK114 family)